MPLRVLIKASPETLSDILLAAEDRYREAEELIVLQKFDGAVYSCKPGGSRKTGAV
jgi:hypothetical protein